MNKETLFKYGLNRALQPYKPKPPGSELESAEGIQSTTERRWFWQKKPDPYDLLTPEERRILKKVKRRAHILDKGFTCCCCQVGLDPIIGLVPFIGDFAGVILALYIVRIAARLDLPGEILGQMMVNIVIDFAIGLVPIIGDLLDIMYKCNIRNAVLLENHLNKRMQERHQEALLNAPPPQPNLAVQSSSSASPTVVAADHASSSSAHSRSQRR